MSTAKGKVKEQSDVAPGDWREMLPSELEALRELAVAAGYESPYPEPGVAPPGTIDDRCEKCGWSMFVSMECAVYCVNEKCAEFLRDTRYDDEEEDVT